MEPSEKRVGVLGATSLVGKALLSQLHEQGYKVVAFSRGQQVANSTLVQWCTMDQIQQWHQKITLWICVAPIWVLSQYLQSLQDCGAQRIVALSSTSIFTKKNSGDTHEQAVVLSLKKGEAAVQKWAEENSVDWCVLRPTLIYGYGKDKNISEIANFIQRFGFFPLFGKAMGLRQPIHADDVAMASTAALTVSNTLNRAYNISGKNNLSYNEMVQGVFLALHRKPRILSIPLFMFRIALAGLHLFPRYQHWSTSMAERMNQDLSFSHSDAVRDFDFAPRKFKPKLKDVTSRI